jgi:hypothetical protein
LVPDKIGQLSINVQKQQGKSLVLFNNKKLKKTSKNFNEFKKQKPGALHLVRNSIWYNMKQSIFLMVLRKVL